MSRFTDKLSAALPGLATAATATLVWLAAAAPCCADDVVTNDEAIRRGREALQEGWLTPPWYDSDRDAIRRMTVREPWDFWDKWNWPNWQSSSSSRWSLPQMSLLEWIAWTLITLLLATIAYFLIRAYLRRDTSAVRASQAASQEVEEADDARIEALPFQLARRASDFLSEAERCRQAGNFREAIIYLFSHQLVALDRHQCIRLTRGKTNRQYLRELGRRTELRSLLEQTMVTFEDVFFGDHTLDAAGFQRCWGRLDEFDSLVNRETAA